VVVTLAAVSWLASPAFACKNLVKFPEHLWGSTVGWWEPYRVVEISEARDDDFVVVVKQNFGSKSDVGKRTMLRFIANEEAYALCPISLVVGGTYLVRSKSSTEALLIQRFNHLNLPSGHPLYGIYLRDLEKAEVRPMYVEANNVDLETQDNRLVLRGKVEIHYSNSILFAERVVDDRSVDQLVAEGNVLMVNADGSSTRHDRLRLSDDYRNTFRGTLVEQRRVPW